MKSIFTAGIFVLFFSGIANATLIKADFRTEANLPDVRTGSPKVYQSLNQSIGAGVELNNTHIFANPDEWGGGEVWMDFNPINYVLTLNSRDTWDFKTFDAWMNNIVFNELNTVISGITLLTNNLITVPQLPALSFTDNSIRISYSTMPSIFNFTGGTATFQIATRSTANPVSAPASIALIALGLLAIRLRQRS